MKVPLVVALIGLAISFALPAFAQQKDRVDPQLREALVAYNKKEDEAWNNNDAVALAALYTEDAVVVTETGTIYGREAIEKRWADLFKQVHFSNHIETGDQYSPHIIGTAGNEAWTSGEWTTTLKGQNFGPVEIKGYWTDVNVREGNNWKDQLETFNITPAPAATPSPTASPSNQ